MKQFRAIVIFLLISLPMATQAAWQLDNDASSVSFNSIKNGQVVESHYFKSISGSIEATPGFTKSSITSTFSNSPISGTSNFSLIILNGFIYLKKTISHVIFAYYQLFYK